MKVTHLPLEGLKLIELDFRKDDRGFFVERFHEDKFKALGLPYQFKQDNHSRSAPGTLRGLHYQFDPPQGKCVGVLSGRIFDVVVDIRRKSTTFGKWYGVELDGESGKLLWVPAGFAHGFCVLGNQPAEVLYKVDELYNPQGESGIIWNDPDLKIQWPIQNPLVSSRDNSLSEFRHYKAAGSPIL